MRNQTQILNPLLYKDWDDLIADNPKVNIFHSRAWAQVLSRTYHYKPVYFCTIHSNSINSILPFMEVKSLLTGKRGVSLPFTDSCEPLLNDEANPENFLEDVCHFGKQHRWRWLQMRGGNWNEARPNQQYYLHELKLNPDTKMLFSNLHPAKRRNIRKAQRHHIRIELKDDNESINAYFYLHCRTRKRHGVPPQPHRFFQNILEHIISQGMGKIILAWHQQQVIAAGVFFHFRKKAIYKFGASDMSFQQFRANDLVMWEAIKWYAEHGYESFSLGRTASDNTGLRRFKTDWGTQERTINYYRYDLHQKVFVSQGASENTLCQPFFRLLPIPALKIVGTIMYKHMG